MRGCVLGLSTEQAVHALFVVDVVQFLLRPNSPCGNMLENALLAGWVLRIGVGHDVFVKGGIVL